MPEGTKYTAEFTGEDGNVRILKVATPFPFPEKLALTFLEGLDEVRHETPVVPADLEQSLSDNIDRWQEEETREKVIPATWKRRVGSRHTLPSWRVPYLLGRSRLWHFHGAQR